MRTKRGKHYFGEDQADLRSEIESYAKTYPATQFAETICACGGRAFRVAVDDEEGAAVRTCDTCEQAHPIGDSADYLKDASLDECECPCKRDLFEVTVGVALYPESVAVKWLYLGLRCTSCGLLAVYGDWKNEFDDYHELLANV